MTLPIPKATDEIINSFKHLLAKRDSVPFDEYIQWALYDERIGYYTAMRQRIGKTQECDFYTSSSIRPLWGELIVEACLNLLATRNPNKFTFIEIAAEPNDTVLKGIKLPFRNHQIIRLSDEVNIPDHAVVYSNEWLDAQPFKRFRYSGTENGWQEIHISIDGGTFNEIGKPIVGKASNELPSNPNRGDLFDWPCGARKSLNNLLSANSWQGLFLTFDYGLPREVLLNDRPLGTARAYYKQSMETNLLLRPTEQDLTCHLCWDDLQDCLVENNFHDTGLKTQESFFLHFASKRVRRAFDEKKESHNAEMQAIKEIIHPAHLGHGLQAFWGLRM